jgi:hypothetical protein
MTTDQPAKTHAHDVPLADIMAPPPITRRTNANTIPSTIWGVRKPGHRSMEIASPSTRRAPAITRTNTPITGGKRISRRPSKRRATGKRIGHIERRFGEPSECVNHR